jgi:hypothetical protein
MLEPNTPSATHDHFAMPIAVAVRLCRSFVQSRYPGDTPGFFGVDVG